MKNLKLILTTLILLVSMSTFAQSDKFNYQAAIRDASGEIMENESVTIAFSIKSGSASGTEVYAETHSATTNDQGLVNLTIGSGAATSGTFDTIDWSADNHFLNVNIDGTDMGTSEFNSVPYANYAENAGNVFSGDYNDLLNQPTIPVEIWQTNTTDVYYNTGSVGIGTMNTNDKLHVLDSNAGTRVRVENTGNNFAGVVSKNSIGEMFVGIQGSGDTNPGEFHIYDNNGGGQRVVIDNNGNFGIGEPDPSEKLEVNGNVKIEGEVYRESTGTANLLPVAFGGIELIGTTVSVFPNKSTENWTVTRVSTGVYDITITGENYYVNDHTCMASIVSPGLYFISTSSVSNKLRVRVYDLSGALADQRFNFVVYKR